MRKRKTIIFLVLLALVVTSFFMRVYYSPRPIITAGENTMILFIHWNSGFGTDNLGTRILLEDYDEDGILSYLSTCTEQPILSRFNGYPIEDIVLELTIASGDDLKHIYFGNINRINRGFGTWEYQIQNPEEVLSTIKKMLLEK